MNPSGDLGDLSDFTISSANEEDLSDDVSHDTEADITPIPRNFSSFSKGNDLQLLKIELSKKSLELEGCRKDYFQREEELQERIDTLLHQRDAVQLQLEHEIKTHANEYYKRHEQLRIQLEQAQRHQNYLENTNAKLVQSTLDLKGILSENLRIDEQRYEELSSQSEFELSFREMIQMKIFEIIKPLLQEVRNLRLEKSDVCAEKEDALKELDDVKLILKEVEENHRVLQQEFKKNLLELSDVKDKVQIGNYKIENFDRLQREKDTIDEKCKDIKSELDRLKVNSTCIENERDQLVKNNLDLNQTNRLLVLDKEYLTKQVHELSMRCNNAEERLQTSWKQLEETKDAREKIYDKYVLARDEFRTQYENKLREELDILRLKTEQEMEKIKINTRELYERELKSLTDHKDAAVSDREIAVRSCRELESKLEKTKTEYVMYQTSAENKISELLNDIKMKAFESERTNILYDECCNKLKMAHLECDKYQAKYEVSTKEYYQLECCSSKRISELELKLDDSTRKNESYEKLEKELDLAIMHAAEEGDGKPVLMWPHGYDSGNPIPTNAGRRMQQSIELARRILHLERMLKERNETNESQTKELEKLKDDLQQCEKILNEAKQPYGYLIEALKKRDTEITKLKFIQTDLTNQLNKLRREKAQVCEEKNKMLSDMEQLLCQKDELIKLRRLVEELKQQSVGHNDINQLNISGKPIKMMPVDPYQYLSSQPNKIRIPPEYAVSRS